MKKVFISRTISSDSIFLNQLNTSGAAFEVHGESLLHFVSVPFQSLPAADWLFFYSQKGVLFFFEQYEQLKTKNTLPYKYAAFGPVTATALTKHTGEAPYFTGTGFADKTAELFYEMAAGDHVCFVQAKNSRKSVQDILLGELQDFDLVVYDNDIRVDFSLPHFDILVFTSPLNAKAYFDKYDLLDNQKVIAIGGTTARSLQEFGVNCIVSNLPNEEGMADACIELL